MSQGLTLPHQPFRDELCDRRRSILLYFYIGVVFSTLAVVLAQKLPSFRSPLLALAVVGAALAILFLLRFLRANDEREQQINYRALTFAFIGTLVFSVCRFLQVSASFRPWLGIPCRDDLFVESRIDSVLVAVSMKTRLRVLRAEKEWSQAELAVHVGVARGTINAIETGKYDPSLPLAFKIARVFGKTVEEVFLYQESESVDGDQSESLT